MNSSWKYKAFQYAHTWYRYRRGTARLEYLTLSGTMAQTGHLRPVMCDHNIWSRTRQTAVRRHFRSAIILVVRNGPTTFTSHCLILSWLNAQIGQIFHARSKTRFLARQTTTISPVTASIFYVLVSLQSRCCSYAPARFRVWSKHYINCEILGFQSSTDGT